MCKKISAVVPVYNMGKYITKCVESLVNQKYKNVEIILVDDGSTDNSGKLCDALASQYHNIKVFHQKNSGVSKARNKGLELATGYYISFIDPDDYLDLQTYETVIALMENNHADIGCYDNYWFENQEPSYDWNNNTNYLFDLYSNNNVTINLLLESRSACRCIYTKQIIKNLHFPIHLTQGEDTIFLANALIQCQRAIHIKAPFYFRRKTPNSATRASYNHNFLDIIKSNEILEEMLLHQNKSNNNLSNYIFFQQISHLLISLKDTYKKHKNDTKYINRKLKIRFHHFMLNPYLKSKEKIIIISFCISPSLYFLLQSLYQKFKNI